jgi:hypothetical protein
MFVVTWIYYVMQVVNVLSVIVLTYFIALKC